MKKIFNWTFGGFFRTIGRTIAFLLLGGLIVLIAQKNDIKITELLGIEHVNAAVTNAPITNKRTLVKWCDFRGEDCGWKSADINTTMNSDGVNQLFELSWRFQSSDGYNANIPYNLSVISTFEDTPLTDKYIKNFKLEIWTSTNQDGSGSLLGSINNNVNNFSCNVGLTTDKTGIAINCSFVPNRKIKSVQLFWKRKDRYYTDYPSSLNTAQDWVKWTNNNFTYNSDESAVINNQTNVIQNQTNEIINQQQQTNDLINDDNITDGQSQANSFFNNFTTNTHGLTGIITAPLNAINSLTSATCSPLVVPLPFVNQNLTLPCMREIYTSNFGGFMTLYDIITTGIIAYWVCVRIFGLVKDFKNPDHDEIEVVDL